MTPKFIRTTIPERENLGEKLAKKRAALGFDIKETERATKIRAVYLEALESGHYDKLPPDVYVRGFLKNYSNFLKLDSDKVIKLYRKEKGLSENVKKVVSPTPRQKTKKKKKQKVLITPQRMVVGVVLTVFFVLVSYIGYQFKLFLDPPKLEIVSPLDNSKVNDASTIIEGKTDPGALVSINDFQISADPEGNFKEKVSLQKGNNIIKITAEKEKMDKKTTRNLNIIADLKDITPTGTERNQTLDMKITIGPNSDSVLVEVDGKPLSEKNVLMLPGASQQIRATEKVSISASDGGSVRITLNGKDLGPLGKTGEKIIKKIFNKDSN